MSIHVSPAGRDFIFSFKDSCNCRCRKPSENDVVYINHHNQIEPFKRITKLVVNPQIEYEKSFTRIRNILLEIFEHNNMNPQVLLKIMEDATHISFQQEIDSHAKCTLGKIERINKALDGFYAVSSKSV